MAYDWLNNSEYHRIVHIHGNNDFGNEFISHIESVWSDLKRLLLRIYVSVKSYNFIHFLKESEWRQKKQHI